MNIKNHFKNKIFAGVLTLVPLGITFFILRFLFVTVDSWLAPIVSPMLGERYHIGMGLLATVLIVYLVGLVVSNIVGRRLVGTGERILTKIPIVREVYSPVKQLVQMVLVPNKTNNLKKTVAIRVEDSPIRVIGFVTGEVWEEGNSVKPLSIFVPTSPNPTTGVLLFCDPDIVYETNIRPETAMKLLVSGGIVAPDNFTIQRLIQQPMRKQKSDH